MTTLDLALEGLFDAQANLNNAMAIESPIIMSKQMMRQSQYLGIVDRYLGEVEQEYEIKLSVIMKQQMNEGMKATPAEAYAKMELAEIKGQIVFLKRISSSASNQISTIQSRIKHIINESQTNI
jgi:hypothetical protein